MRTGTRAMHAEMTGRNVFFVGEASLPGDSYVNVRASSYGEMRAILMSSFQCLQRGNFVMAERQDGTLVCDDDYYQSLQSDTELVVLVDNAANHKTGKVYPLHYLQYATSILPSYNYIPVAQ